ncbi:MAG: MBL fold metallo-hydrolase [Promethearchaeia archaeon]
MKVTFLGTAGSFISEERTYPSYLVNEDLLLDCGEGTTQKLLKLGVIDKISIICISHLHNDHFLGLFSLLWYWYINRCRETLTLIGPPNTQKTIDKILDLIHTPKDMRTFNIQYKELNNGQETQKLEGTDNYEIQAYKMEHLEPTFGFKIRVGNRTVGYSSDSRPNDNLDKLAKDCDLLIGEATYPDSLKDLAFKHSHSSPSQMARTAENSNCPQLALVHISPVFHNELDKFKESASKVFNGEVIIPQDLDIIEL